MTLTAFLVSLGIVAAAKGIASLFQFGAAKRAKEDIEDAIEDVYQIQKTRMQHGYEATLNRLIEQEATILGGQRQILGAAGHAGGAGTLGATVAATTSAKAEQDRSLLDQQYEDAQADLKAQTDLAKEKLQADYEVTIASIATGFITDIVDIGVGAATFGMSMKTPATGAGSTALTAGEWGLTGAGGYVGGQRGLRAPELAW